MPIDAASLKTGIAPPAAVIRQTAEEVLKGGDFRLDRGVGEPEMPLWLDLLLGLFEKIEEAFYAVGALPLVLRIVIAVVLVAILAAIVWHTVTAILPATGEPGGTRGGSDPGGRQRRPRHGGPSALSGGAAPHRDRPRQAMAAGSHRPRRAPSHRPQPPPSATERLHRYTRAGLVCRPAVHGGRSGGLPPASWPDHRGRRRRGPRAEPAKPPSPTAVEFSADALSP